MNRWIASFGILSAALLLEGAAGTQDIIDRENPAIRYAETTPNDPISRLQRRIDRGEVKLKFEMEHGYLRSLLHELRIPVASQILVFSKTSAGKDRISPETPRAIYFNDRAYVGLEQGGKAIEV